MLTQLPECIISFHYRTDSLIQEVLCTTFAHCTILTIAHRLHTVMGAERIMVIQMENLKYKMSKHFLFL